MQNIHRCFLCDVPTEVERQRQLLQQQQPDHDENINAGGCRTTPLALRLLGIVVDLRTDPTYHNTDSAIDIVLDDGSGLMVPIQASLEMTERIHVQISMTLECVAKVILLDDDCKSYILQAKQLVVLQDTHAETLRWLELSYRKIHTVSEQYGYPCDPYSAEDLYHVILSCADDRPRNNSKDSGISVEELSSCLDLTMPYLEGLLEELQISGQIYRNTSGLFLPL